MRKGPGARWMAIRRSDDIRASRMDGGSYVHPWELGNDFQHGGGVLVNGHGIGMASVCQVPSIIIEK